MMCAYLLRQVDQASRRWKADFDALWTPSFADTDEGMNNPRWNQERGKVENAREHRRLSNAIAKRRVAGDRRTAQRTPLEPQVVGAILRPGYRVEKVIFQSQPKHYVTARPYLPPDDSSSRRIRGCSWRAAMHRLAREAAATRRWAIRAKRHGCPVSDPVEQGERLQYAYSVRSRERLLSCSVIR